jgi:hypothetical protein
VNNLSRPATSSTQPSSTTTTSSAEAVVSPSEKILIKVGSRAVLAHQKSYKFNPEMSLLSHSMDDDDELFDLVVDPFEFGVEQLMMKGYLREDAETIYRQTHTVEEGGWIETKVILPYIYLLFLIACVPQATD